MFRNVAFSLVVIGVFLSIGGPARAAVIDDFSVDDLANYTNTVILANAGAVNTATWQMGGGSLTFNTSTYNNINMNALTRNGLSLNVGEEVQLLFMSPPSGNQGIGLYVGTQPVFNDRAASDYVTMYARTDGQF